MTPPADEAEVIRAAAPRIVVRPALVRCHGGEGYTGWQVWLGRRIVARHDFRRRAILDAKRLAGIIAEEAAQAPPPA